MIGLVRPETVYSNTDINYNLTLEGQRKQVNQQSLFSCLPHSERARLTTFSCLPRFSFNSVMYAHYIWITPMAESVRNRLKRGKNSWAEFHSTRNPRMPVFRE